ncbi:MAG TPA: chloride channel protein [Acidimicrobiia bacterium]|nr:chloride channel protein [Acidimicrobiia bacterium]
MQPTVRRIGFLVILAVPIGLAAGGAAWILLRLIGLITNLALFHRVGWSIPSLVDLQPSPWLVVAALLGGLTVSLMARWDPSVRGHGIPEAMTAVLTRQSRMRPRTAVAKPLSVAVAIGTGAPFGAEGPIIVTGGALGSLLGQILRVTPSERKILLGCGAAAGTAAVFGTPLAAVVLAIELLLFEFSVRALLPIIASASIAGGVHVALFGAQPLFHVPQHEFSGLGHLWVFALVGVACGLLSAVVCRGLFLVEALYRRLPVRQFWHPMIGALGFALIGLFVPRVLGTGYVTIEEVLSDRLTIETVLVVFVAKLVAWWVALGSSTSGSILAPMLLISGSFGAALGWLLDAVAPSVGIPPGAMALVAMSATVGASTGASLTFIVFAFELTRDYNAILPLMLASVLANLVTLLLLKHNLLTEKLGRGGIGVPKRYEPDVLRGTLVKQAMSTPAATIGAGATVGDARLRIESGEHSAYPLVDDDERCVGIVSRGDLLGTSVDDDEPVTAAASTDVVTVRPDDSMLTALARMTEEKVDHLPVVSGDRLVGVCARNDVLRARGQHLGQERFEEGWKPPWLSAIRRFGP